MPTTSRVTIRISIIYLCLGAALGALLLVNRWILLGPAVSVLRISHISMLVIGWLTQLILGVAWWLLPPLGIRPRTGDGPPRRGQAQRGSEPLFWATVVCLNIGVLMQALFQPLFLLTQANTLGRIADLADLFLLAASVTFVVNLWARVRGRGRRG
jgi:hypothetical protein